MFGDLQPGQRDLVQDQELPATGPDSATGIGLDYILRYILHVVTGGQEKCGAGEAWSVVLPGEDPVDTQVQVIKVHKCDG